MPIVNEVERVEGLTVDLLAISLATSGRLDFCFPPKRFNLDVSRARTKLIVACSPMLPEAMPADYAAFLGR